MDLKTDIAKVKRHGSARSGTHHWLYQRITAIILLLCSFWLIFFIKCSMGSDLSSFIRALQKPYNIVAICILVVTSFYHAMLGMRVVIEDYIHCPKLRTTLIILLQLFCLITNAAFIVGMVFVINSNFAT